MNSKKREDIKRGLKVNIVLKKDQKSGKLTGGVVKDILTNSSFHSHGIKVRLENADLEEFRRYLRASLIIDNTHNGLCRHKIVQEIYESFGIAKMIKYLVQDCICKVHPLGIISFRIYFVTSFELSYG